MARVLDLTDLEILPDGEVQPAPFAIKDRDVAMRFGRVIGDVNAMLDRGAITVAQAEELWKRAVYQARQDDRHTGIITVRA